MLLAKFGYYKPPISQNQPAFANFCELLPTFANFSRLFANNSRNFAKNFGLFKLFWLMKDLFLVNFQTFFIDTGLLGLELKKFRAFLGSKLAFMAACLLF